MSLPVPTLDHVVINTRDGLDEAVARYRRLGFAMTPRGHHSFGTINHLAMFGTDYLELLGAPPGRDDLLPMAWPAGLNAIVFGTDDAVATHAALTKADVPAGAVLPLSRPVATPGGLRDAAFNLVFLPEGTLPSGRAYFCQHLTRDLVWRDDDRHHSNGVVGIDTIVIAARAPAAFAEVFGRMFGADAVAGMPGGIRLACGLTRLEVVAPSVAAERLGEQLLADGAAAVMAGLILRTSMLSRAGAALQAGGIAVREDADGRLHVSATDTSGVALVFAD